MSKLFVNFVQKINASQIRDESMDGVDYIVVSSKTMPDDIVMNGIMYPADQIDATIKTIDESPAPLGHPMIDGKYVSAYNQRAQNTFNQAGGINKYIKKDGDSHIVEKWFVKELLTNTAQGKSLLDAIDKQEPINSSTGVILNKVASKGENKYGKYEFEARINHFDHDAVLIGDIGAATPEQGVGLMVNSQEEIETIFCNLSSGLDMSESANVLREKLSTEVNATFGGENKHAYMMDHNADTVIFELYENEEYTQYQAAYEIQGEIVKLGQHSKVEREVVYKSAETGMFANAYKAFKNIFKPTPTIEQDDNTMNKFVTALNDAGVKTEGLSKDQLFEAYNTHITVTLAANKADEPKPLTAEAIADLITNGVTAGIKAHTDSQEIVVKSALVEQVIANNKLYTEDDKETLMATPEKVLNSMIPEKRAASLRDGIQHNSDDSPAALPE